MTNPAIQNDFSYYRRTLSRMRINNVPVSECFELGAGNNSSALIWFTLFFYLSIHSSLIHIKLKLVIKFVSMGNHSCRGENKQNVANHMVLTCFST